MDGVPLGGGNELVVLVGGVCDRAPDRIVALSVGDKRCDKACGTESSNISWRSTAEYVRFASSATWRVSYNAYDTGSCEGLLFWKCSSLWGVRLDLEGVAGEPSSCRRLKLACRSCPARLGMNLNAKLVSCRNRSITRPSTYLSPCIRGLLRLGLAIGVRSRTLPACSKSLSAFESADASTGSEFRLRV